MKRASRRSPGNLTIHVTFGSRAWIRKLRTTSACVKRAAVAAMENSNIKARFKLRGNESIEVGITLGTNHSLQRLNRKFRAIDKPTNVLSFPCFSPGDTPIPNAPVLLGDIALAYGVVEKEARFLGKPFQAHLSHMVVHGVLHLLGYDHVTNTDAKKMESLEIRILAQLGLANPYAEIEVSKQVAKQTRLLPEGRASHTRAKK